MSTTAAQPLAGIRVIDLTSVMFGPYATQLLGDYGADVIKIEAPGGDPTRGIGPARNPNMAAGFLGCNRNKRSVVLDLKRAPARDALWRLIETADVFAHNVRPQKIAALGFDPDAVMQAKPNIVYGAFHGYLEEGPYGGRPAYDDVIQGESGIAAAFLARDGEPAFAPSVIADKSAGLIAANALLAALFQRMRTGTGVYMEIGMFESMVAYTLLEHQFGLTFEPPRGGAGYTRVISPERRPFKTADGYLCMLAYTDAQWHAFWDLAGTPALKNREEFQTLADRTRHIDELYAGTAEVLVTRTTEQWLAQLTAAEIPCGRINTFDDLLTDAHLSEIGFFSQTEHPTEGALRTPDGGVRFNRERLGLRCPAPNLGEHGHDVLAEAGLSNTEITAALKAAD